MIKTQHLKAKRTLYKLSQRELAKRLNISDRSYCMKEVGDSLFTTAELIVLKKELKLTPNEIDFIFLGGECE